MRCWTSRSGHPFASLHSLHSRDFLWTLSLESLPLETLSLSLETHSLSRDSLSLSRLSLSLSLSLETPSLPLSVSLESLALSRFCLSICLPRCLFLALFCLEALDSFSSLSVPHETRSQPVPLSREVHWRRVRSLETPSLHSRSRLAPWLLCVCLLVAVVCGCCCG